MNLPPDRVLEVDRLGVRFTTPERSVDAVRDLSFHIDRGETLAVVGESGSGKSVTSLALMRLVEYGGGRIVQGRMAFRTLSGNVLDLASAGKATMRGIRGSQIAMIFQEPMTSLNPSLSVGDQIAESIRVHQHKGRAESRAEALRMLDLVRIPEARAMLDRFPHQLSGGMRQRVVIAMALCCRPSLLIADEPTTALDVTIQAQVLQLIRELQAEMRMAVLFITHDMGVVAEVADRVLVMLKGDKVEEGAAESLFNSPRHPYTRALLAAVPRLGAMRGTELPARFDVLGDVTGIRPAGTESPPPAHDTVRREQGPVLSVRRLTTRFDLRSGLFSRVTRRVHAVEGVTFDLYPGETLSLVGESGCGKSTTGRSLLRLVHSQAGQVLLGGQDITRLGSGQLQPVRRQMQYVFQDPYASLNPRQTVGYSIMEPLLVHGTAESRARV
jgi:glutathione transport system ATP-binding protein